LSGVERTFYLTFLGVGIVPIVLGNFSRAIVFFDDWSYGFGAFFCDFLDDKFGFVGEKFFNAGINYSFEIA
jgi:hypothetical protein